MTTNKNILRLNGLPSIPFPNTGGNPGETGISYWFPKIIKGTNLESVNDTSKIIIISRTDNLITYALFPNNEFKEGDYVLYKNEKSKTIDFKKIIKVEALNIQDQKHEFLLDDGNEFSMPILKSNTLGKQK